MLLLDILARTNRQIKDIQTEKEEAKLSYSDDTILYTENPKALTKLLTKKWVQQGCSIQIDIQKPTVLLLYISNGQYGNEI